MADLSKFHGDTGVMAHGGTSAGTIADNIDEIRSAVAAAIGELRAWWDGQAEVACETAFAKWDADAVQLCVMLRGIGDNTMFASNVYVAADDAGATNFNAVQGHLIRNGLKA
jgi:WXG100 family type VII secretion target